MSTGRAKTQSMFRRSMTILVSKLPFRTTFTLLLFHSRNRVKIMVPAYFLELSFPSISKRDTSAVCFFEYD